MLRKLTSLLLCSILATACSSPPEPAAIDWDKPATQMNPDISRWYEKKAFTPSEQVTGRWSLVITNFTGDTGTYSTNAWYAIAHSSHIVIAASDASEYWKASDWLRQHGSTALLSYQQKICLLCTVTDIYLSR